MRPQDRAPNYPVASVWAVVLLCIGVGAWFIGMAIHGAWAAQQGSRPAAIYYCSTGTELPMFEPCKEMKDRRDI